MTATAPALVLVEPEFRALEARALSWPEQANGLAVESDIDFKHAGTLLVDIKTLRGEIDATFDPIISAAHQSHRVAIEKKRTAEGPLVIAESAIKAKMGSYHAAQERRRREEQLRLEAEAKRAEEDARLREAEALEAVGQHQEAERVIEEPSYAPPVTPIVAKPKAVGVVARETWKAEVINKMELVKAVAAGTVPLAVLDVNQTVLNAQARSLKKELRYPGVRVYPDTSIAARGRTA